jgi:hypothetical protein
MLKTALIAVGTLAMGSLLFVSSVEAFTRHPVRRAVRATVRTTKAVTHPKVRATTPAVATTIRVRRGIYRATH